METKADGAMEVATKAGKTMDQGNTRVLTVEVLIATDLVKVMVCICLLNIFKINLIFVYLVYLNNFYLISGY